MAASAKFNGIEIPKIFEWEEEAEPIADIARTAGGKERMDVAAVKRTWTGRTRHISPAQAETLQHELASILYRYGDFWYETFGSEANTVRARIELQVRRSHILPDCRELTLTVIEQ